MLTIEKLNAIPRIFTRLVSEKQLARYKAIAAATDELKDEVLLHSTAITELICQVVKEAAGLDADTESRGLVLYDFEDLQELRAELDKIA